MIPLNSPFSALRLVLYTLTFLRHLPAFLPPSSHPTCRCMATVTLGCVSRTSSICRCQSYKSETRIASYEGVSCESWKDSQDSTAIGRDPSVSTDAGCCPGLIHWCLLFSIRCPSSLTRSYGQIATNASCPAAVNFGHRSLHVKDQLLVTYSLWLIIVSAYCGALMY